MDEIKQFLLRIVGYQLFGGERPKASAVLSEILKEAKSQTVFTMIFPFVQDDLMQSEPQLFISEQEDFFRYAVAGTQNFAEHSELHELMTANSIPYVVMKGFASALYYPEPSLRSMGDVDFLVRPEDIEQAGKALEGAGFAVDHGDDDDGIHIAYQRPPISVWELHRSINGIPDGEIGENIRTEMNRMIESAELVNQDDIICMVPDRFHHGLIMLLHTASHLTSEGVGLRHLCDWVVFASSLSDAEFRTIFEKKLKAFGLWRFAQVLTLLGINYLGAPKRVWALEAIESHKVDDDTLKGLMNDILSGGNFGFKDMNRYREIKYISDRGERTVSSGGILRQGFKTMNKKVRADHKFIGKHKLLLPVGYIAEGGKYIGLLISGKRKTSGTKQMFKEAAERKRIYHSLCLFEK